VVSDHPLYHWVGRDDGTNASVRPPDRVLLRRPARGPRPRGGAHGARAVRDRLLAHWYRSKVLARLGSARLLTRAAEQRPSSSRPAGARARSASGRGVRAGSAPAAHPRPPADRGGPRRASRRSRRPSGPWTRDPARAGDVGGRRLRLDLSAAPAGRGRRPAAVPPRGRRLRW
jgi:hypothetical protein